MLQNWTASPERFAGLPEFFDAIAQKSGDQSELTLLCWSVLSSEVKAASISEPTMIQLQLRLPAVTPAAFGTIGSVTELHAQLKARYTAQIVSKWMAATASDLSPRCISCK